MRIRSLGVLLGAALFATAATVQAVKPPNLTFSVLTYNIQVRPVLDKIHIKARNIGPLLSRYDVVGVQECFDQCERLVKVVDLPNRLIFNTPKNDGRKIGSGLAMMTKLRVLGSNTVHYRMNAGKVEQWASKGLMMMHLDGGGGRVVDVYDTHMQAGGGDEGNVAHRAQVDDIIAFINKNSPPDHSVVLLGDFNMRPTVKDMKGKDPEKFKRSAHFKALMDGLKLKDVAIELFGHTHEDIDRVFFRAGKDHVLTPVAWSDESKTFTDKRGQDMSDHPPIKATLRLGSK